MSLNNNNRVGIIGAGLSSLYAACYLSKNGYDVTVFEKNKMSGGRLQTFEADGFKFDMGPSWYWMPDLIDQLFQDLGENREDRFELTQLTTAYQVLWQDDSKSKITSDKKNLQLLFDDFESNGGEKLEKFLADAKIKYDVAKELLENPGLSISELLKWKVVKNGVKLDVLKSVDRDVSKRFQSEKARSILNFPVLFLGAMPNEIPSLYTLMNYADLELGTWYPKGGMHKLAHALETIAIENGTRFQFNSSVQEIIESEGKVIGVLANDETHSFDYVISGADYHFTEQHLLPKKFRKYHEKYWDKRKMAPSSLIFYLGIDQKIQDLEHHNLFFDENLFEHGKEIYSDPKWPTKPLFYVCCPSKTDMQVAPDGKENMFILMPIAPDLEDNNETREKYLNLILDRIEKRIGVQLRDKIVFKRSFCVSDFKSEYNSFKGNAYGLANTLGQTANLKPRMKSKLKNMYYCGQLTVPGPGMPPAIISGKIAAKQIIES